MSKTSKVKVVEKSPGTKVEWEQSGTRLFFGDDELMVNVAKYQKDWPVQVDVCADENKNLVIGVGVGRYYVAQVDIPPTEYIEVETEAEETLPTAEGESENTDTTPKTTKKLEPQPLDMADVVLTLWSMDDLKANN